MERLTLDSWVEGDTAFDKAINIPGVTAPSAALELGYNQNGIADMGEMCEEEEFLFPKWKKRARNLVEKHEKLRRRDYAQKLVKSY